MGKGRPEEALVSSLLERIKVRHQKKKWTEVSNGSTCSTATGAHVNTTWEQFPSLLKNSWTAAWFVPPDNVARYEPIVWKPGANRLDSAHAVLRENVECRHGEGLACSLPSQTAFSISLGMRVELSLFQSSAEGS